MQYIYNWASLPPIASEELKRLDSAAARLATRLKAADPAKLPLSDYGKDTVALLRERVDETLKKYVHLLAWVLYPVCPNGHDAIVDYGGGHGLLACLAKEAGFRGVVYNDIFSGSCDDARQLAQYLGCPAEEYVCGDIQSVSNHFRSRTPSSAAVVSINVIEHIYDMNDFIRVAGSISYGPMTMVLSTSANPLNPAVARRHYRQHRLWEFTDGPHESSYPMDTMRAFYSVRRDIIKAAAPELNDSDVDSLAAATRGMWKPDVEKCVTTFLETRVMPSLPKHPTNTCDPITGSWQERLLDISEMRQEFEKSGFVAEAKSGYYGGFSKRPGIGALKQTAAGLLNHAISLLGSNGLSLAPCFMFHAARR